MDHAGTPSDISEGARATRDYVITQGVYDHFIAAFGDVNPLHVDDEFARGLGFEERVTHGVILNGFVSHFLGMHYPGGRVLLHSVNTQFKSPCHIGDRIRIDAIVTRVSSSVGAVSLDLVLTNTTRDRVAAKSKVQVGLFQ